METLLNMEKEQLYHYTESTGFFNTVCFYIGRLHYSWMDCIYG